MSTLGIQADGSIIVPRCTQHETPEGFVFVDGAERIDSKSADYAFWHEYYSRRPHKATKEREPEQGD